MFFNSALASKRITQTSRWLALIALINVAGLPISNAQISIPDPGKVAYCPDYFNDVWDQPLDMSDATHGLLNDIPAGQIKDVSSFDYSNGIVSFVATGPLPTVSLLFADISERDGTRSAIPVGSLRHGAQLPVDTTKYQYMVFRMYAQQSGFGQVKWDYWNLKFATTNFSVLPGWHTYAIDLKNATLDMNATTGADAAWGLGQVTGLSILPLKANVGATIAFDYIRLVPDISSCPLPLNFSASAQGGENRYALVVDSDLDPSNGFMARTSGNATGTLSSNLTTHTLMDTSYKMYGLVSGDYATVELLNAFDMDSANDIDTTTFGRSAFGFTPSFSGGVLSGTTTDGDPSFYLNIPGDRPIQADIYRYITIKIATNSPNPEVLQLFYGNSKTGLKGSQSTTINPGGYQEVQFLLGSANGWTGDIDYMRVDPVNAVGVTFSIDFVAIHTSNFVSSLTMPSVTPAAGDLKVNVLRLSVLQPDKKGGKDFAQTVLGNPWNMDDVGDLPGGTFNVTTSIIYPNGSLVDPAGTTQYGSFLYATNSNDSGNGDANYILLNGGTGFNPAEYVNLCFSAWNKTEVPNPGEALGYNSVARIIWSDPALGESLEAYRDGDDIIMTRGYSEYCVDMQEEIQIEAGKSPDQGGSNVWTASAPLPINYFRIDLNENTEIPGENYYSVMDAVTLRTDHQVSKVFPVVVRAPFTQAVSLYIKPAVLTQKSASGGTLIGSLSAGRNSEVFKWDVSSTADGLYYLYAVSSDNGNSVSTMAPGRIYVNKGLPADTEDPTLVCDRPENGFQFKSQLELTGYALDDTRLATIEVFIDNNWVMSFLPDQFSYAAATAFSTYAESNKAGYQKFYDGSGLSEGDHTLLLRAYDTAGNTAACSYTVRRNIATSDPTPITLQNPTTDTLAVPQVTPVPTPIPPNSATISATIEKRKNVAIKLSFSPGSCSQLDVLGAADESFASSRLITSLALTGETSLTAENIPGVRKQRKNKGKKRRKKTSKMQTDGTIFLKAICIDGTTSNTISVNTRKLSKKKAKSDNNLLAVLSRKLK